MTERLGQAVQEFLDRMIHPSLLKMTGIDMDKFQADVHASMPTVTYERGFAFVAAMTLFWLVVIFTISNVALPVLMNCLGSRIRGIYDKMDDSSKSQLVITLTSQLHVCFFVPTHVYGMLYADGKKGTNIFIDDDFMATAFDS